MDDNHHDTVETAHAVADKLHQHGHVGHAGALRTVLAESRPGSMLLAALRETCQVVLTAIEAIDPVCATFVEELRLKVDKQLKDEHRSAVSN